MRCDDDADFKKWIEEKKYQSPKIVNECINLMSAQVVQNLLSRITQNMFFAIIADETRDVQNKEQLSLCIRSVDDKFCVHEDFVSMIHVEKTDAESLSKEIKDKLNTFGLTLQNCRGQGYDGAATMIGRLNGVGARIQREESTAITVHCLAHSLNLCLQDAAKTCDMVRNSISLIKDITQLILNSPKRHLVFQRIQTDSARDASNL